MMGAIEHGSWILEPLDSERLWIRNKYWDHIDVEVPIEALQKGVALALGVHDDRSAGAELARTLKLEPHRIVEAFLGALEDANQHDFHRIVEAEWKKLTGPGNELEKDLELGGEEDPGSA